MSFLDKTTSFTLFQLTGLPDGILDTFGDRLRQFAFMPIDDNAEVSGYGWTSMQNMEDFDFSAGFEINKYFYFAFRVDTRKIAPAVYKRHFQLALTKEEQELAKIGKKYITKDRKKEIKEQVRLKLLARTLPTPAVYDVVWDTASNIIYFACTNKKIIELFGNYFFKTLGIMVKDKGEQLTFEDVEKALSSPLKDVKIYQLTPYNRGFLFTEENKEQYHKLEELFPTSFSGEQPFDFDRNKNVMLGEEFLTWLWYHADILSFYLFNEKNEEKQINIYFENKLSVRGTNGENSLQTNLSGNNNPLDEARFGLCTGKKVNNACIVFSGRDDISFLFSLNAKNFSFSSFQILDCKFERSDFQTFLLLKMHLFERAMIYFNAVYQEFLNVRLDEKAWKSETEDIRTWIIQFANSVSKKQLIKLHENYMQSIKG